MHSAPRRPYFGKKSESWNFLLDLFSIPATHQLRCVPSWFTDALLREIAHRELKEYKKNQEEGQQRDIKEGQQRDIKVQCKLCPKKMLPKNLNEHLRTLKTPSLTVEYTFYHHIFAKN